MFDLGRVNRENVSYDVRYVGAVHNDFSGKKVPLDGGAFLELHLGSPAYVWKDGRVVPTWAPANPMRAVNVSGFRTLRQVALVSSWEGTSQVGIGVRGRLPFRTFTTTRASDGHVLLTVEVRHRW